MEPKVSTQGNRLEDGLTKVTLENGEVKEELGCLAWVDYGPPCLGCRWQASGTTWLEKDLIELNGPGGQEDFIRAEREKARKALADGTSDLCWKCRAKSAGQTPSLGRIVHFHEEGGPYSAIITAVNPDGTVELATFGRNSLYFQHGVKPDVVDIRVPPGFDRKPEPGTWSWPPRA